MVTVPFGERSRGDTRGCQRASRAPVRRKRERRQSSEKVRGVNHITLSSRIGAVLLVDFDGRVSPRSDPKRPTVEGVRRDSIDPARRCGGKTWPFVAAASQDVDAMGPVCAVSTGVTAVRPAFVTTSAYVGGACPTKSTRPEGRKHGEMSAST